MVTRSRAIFLVVGAAFLVSCGVNASRMQANEVAAIRAIVTVNTAQVQYFSQFARYATTLRELGPPASGQPAPSAADLIPADLAGGTKFGYRLQMQGTAKEYSITGVPETYNGTGRRSFYSDQTMVIRESEGPEPATASSKEVSR
jgi:hypothetical protein